MKKNVIIIIKTFSFLGKDVQERRLNHFRNEIVAVSTKKKNWQTPEKFRDFFFLGAGHRIQLSNE